MPNESTTAREGTGSRRNNRPHIHIPRSPLIRVHYLDQLQQPASKVFTSRGIGALRRSLKSIGVYLSDITKVTAETS